jgi:hypothetical protein
MVSHPSEVVELIEAAAETVVASSQRVGASRV